MAKIHETEVQKYVNLIAPDATFIGDILTSGDCRIDGTFKGNIQSKAKVIVGEKANIEGEIQCQSIDIEGNIKGDIQVKELMALKATAVLKGNIEVDRLSIEPGAHFTGNCKMTEIEPKVSDNTLPLE